MDKETLSNYGWIVICVLVLSVMIALATPFGTFVSDAVKSTTQGLFDVNQGALDAAGILISDNSFSVKLLSGNNQSYVKRKSAALSFRSSAEINDFVSVAVDGEIIDENNYTVTEGSTIITLLQEYLNQLPVGTHTITIESTTGTVTATFVVNEPEKDPALNPDDGSTPYSGQRYKHGDYVYRYVENNDGWKVTLNTDITDKAKTSYGVILESINGKPVKNLNNLFQNCNNLLVSPAIPYTVTSMFQTYASCDSLMEAPDLSACTSLTLLNYTFQGCTSLTDLSDFIIPVSVTTMNCTFSGCTSMTSAPIIPNRITDLYQTFSSCKALTGTVTIHANPESYNNCFYAAQTSQDITLTGNSDILQELANTSTSGRRIIYDADGNILMQ